MSDIDTGGPAFPMPETEKYHPQFGMTMRDYFASAALTGILSGPCGKDGVQVMEWLDCPLFAYQIADQMLAARAALNLAKGE